MARQCQNCHTELSGHAKFCRMCGTPAATGRSPNSLPSTEKISANIPATEILTPFLPVSQQSRSSRDASLPRANTAQTEPVSIPSSMGSEPSAKEISALLIAPPTRAIVGFFEQAGFGLRLAAFLFDLLIVMSLLLIPSFLAAHFTRWSGLLQSLGLLLALLFEIGNLLLLPCLKGQTIGKRLVGIRVITLDGHRASAKQIAMRHLLGYPLSMLGAMLGFLWILWDPRQQGWHDKVARTRVICNRWE